MKTNPGSKPPRGSHDCKRNFKGVRHFTQRHFPKGQYPKWQLTKGYVRPSETPEAAMGAERCGYDGLGGLGD